MMQPPHTPKGSQFIVTKLSFDILKILHDALTDITPLNQNRLVVQILLTLSHGIYVNGLLFRDFASNKKKESWHTWQVSGNKQIRIHQHSIIYLETVLMRRLTLANNLEEKPSNMHRLLKRFCQHGPREYRWEQVELQRDKNCKGNCEDQEFFQRIARPLKVQCQKLNNRFGEISQRRRKQYGPLWLRLDHCAVEVPEELALFFEVLEVLPRPLRPNFAHCVELKNILTRVLESLNERYMLLRSCGLNPEEWMERDEPSVSNLREMKKLRQVARSLLKEGKDSPNSVWEAYQKAFKSLQGTQKKFAGCQNFKEFVVSDYGMIMLSYPIPIYPVSSEEEDENREGPEETNRPNNEENFEKKIINREHMQRFTCAHPELFYNNKVMLYFFIEILSGHQPFPPLEMDFKKLLDTDPRYAPLSEEERVKVLAEHAEEIMKQWSKRLHKKRGRDYED